MLQENAVKSDWETIEFIPDEEPGKHQQDDFEDVEFIPDSNPPNLLETDVKSDDNTSGFFSKAMNWFSDAVTAQAQLDNLMERQKGEILSGAIQGTVGSFVGQPAEIVGTSLKLAGDMADMPTLKDLGSEMINKSNAFDEFLGKRWFSEEDEIIDPRIGQISKVLAGGGAQVLPMQAMSKYLGGAATYLLYGVPDAGETYFEARDAGKSKGEAGLIGSSVLGGYYVIDRFVDGSKLIKGMKNTSSGLLDILMNSGKEAGAESLQQSYKNLVAKVGYDDARNLMEGVIEAGIGGFAGGAVAQASVSIGGVDYNPSKRYNEARQNALNKGATEQDIGSVISELYNIIDNNPQLSSNYLKGIIEKNSSEVSNLIRQMPTSVAYQGVDNFYKTVDEFINNNEGTIEAKEAQKIKQELDDVYKDTYSALENLMPKEQAAANAKLVQGHALFASREFGITPKQYMDNMFADVELSEYNAQNIQKPQRPKSLLQFLIKNGGIKDENGELSALDAQKGRPGLVNNKYGISLDQARELAEEAGYFGIQAKNNLGSTSISDLLELIDRELRGEKVFTEEDYLRQLEIEERKNEESSLEEAEYYYEKFLDEEGIDYSQMSFDEKKDAYNKLQAFTTWDDGSYQGEDDLIYDKNGNVLFQEQLDLAEEMLDIDAHNDEYTGETININGVERSVYNSNGDRIAKSEEALRAFYNWFGDSKVVDGQGRPLVVYHGSTKVFDTFDISKTSKESNLGAGFYFTNNEDDVSRNYEGGGPDFENRVARIAERIQEEEDISYEEAEEKARKQEFDESVKYPVYLKMENPFVIGGENETILTLKEEYNEETDEYGEPEGTLIEFAYQLDNALADVGIDYQISQRLFEKAAENGGEISASEIDDILRNDEELYSLYDYESSQGQLLSDVVGIEYDGFIDNTVNKKFGSERKTGKPMEGMDESTSHYIAFSPNQIKSVDNRGTFSESENIYWQGSIANKNGNVELYIDSKKEMKNMTEEEFRNKMLNTLLSFKNNKIYNESLGADIEIRTSSIKKYKSFFADKNKRLIVPYIPELLQKANFSEIEKSYIQEKEPNIKAYYKADIGIDIDGNYHNVHLTVREDNKGNLFWDAQVKEGSQHATPATNPGDTTPIDINISLSNKNVKPNLQNQSGKPPRGAYYNGIIHLFQNADASTFIHESMHFYKEELKRLKDKSARAKSILNTLEAFSENEFEKNYKVKANEFGYSVVDKNGRTVYNNQDQFFSSSDEAREYAKEEIIARGFEQYVREGKSPSKYLSTVFRSFMNWLKHIYTTAKSLGVELNDDVRRAYGDLLGGQDLDYWLVQPTEAILKETQSVEQDRKTYLDDIISDAISNKGTVLSRFKGKGARDIWVKSLIPLSTRAKRISPKLRNRLRLFEFNLSNELNKKYNKSRPFLEVWKKMSEDDVIAFDLALKNDYVEKQQEIISKYNAQEEWANIKELLADIYSDSMDVGLDLGYRKDYFPRKVKDVKGFMAYMHGLEDWTRYQQALKEADPNNIFTMEEQAEFLNKYMRGFVRVDLMPVKYGSEKTRKIPVINNEINKFYAESMESYVSYIEGMNARIESAKFLGKGSQSNDESIGEYLSYLLDQKLISNEQVDDVREILQARFGQIGVRNRSLSTLRDLSYIYTMGGINSAITQLEDFSISMYKAGVWNTLSTVFEKKQITKKDLGIEKVSQEFVDIGKTSKWLNSIFKATGLDAIDSLGKETFVNSLIKKYKQIYSKNPQALRDYIEPIMEDRTNSTINDIINGKKTDDVLFLLFSELSDVQPVSLSELPEYYNKAGNWRILYMLKTFAVKRIDTFRNEVFDKIRTGDKDERIKGIKNLLSMSILMMLCGATKDWIIDFIYGRKTEMTDRMTSNLFGLFGLSKFHFFKLKEQGVTGVFKEVLFPPILSFFDDFLEDIWKISLGKRDIKDMEILKGVPFFGRFYYWQIGRGAEKQKKQNKRVVR